MTNGNAGGIISLSVIAGLISLVGVGIVECTNSFQDRRKAREEATHQAQRQAEEAARVAAEEHRVKELFDRQVAVNSFVEIIRPYPSDRQSEAAALVLVRIDKSLIEAAVQEWSMLRGGESSQDAVRVRAELEQRYLRNDRLTFLLLSSAPFSDYFQYRYSGLSRGIEAYSFDGSTANNADSSGCRDNLLYVGAGTHTCLFFVTPVHSFLDPLYRIVIREIFWSKWQAGHYIEEVEPHQAWFEIEVGEVGLIDLVSERLDWDVITNRHVNVKTAAIAALQGELALGVLQIAPAIIRGLLFKGVRM